MTGVTNTLGAVSDAIVNPKEAAGAARRLLEANMNARVNAVREVAEAVNEADARQRDAAAARSGIRVRGTPLSKRGGPTRTSVRPGHVRQARRRPIVAQGARRRRLKCKASRDKPPALT